MCCVFSCEIEFWINIRFTVIEKFSNIYFNYRGNIYFHILQSSCFMTVKAEISINVFINKCMEFDLTHLLTIGFYCIIVCCSHYVP